MYPTMAYLEKIVRAGYTIQFTEDIGERYYVHTLSFDGDHFLVSRKMSDAHTGLTFFYTDDAFEEAFLDVLPLAFTLVSSTGQEKKAWRMEKAAGWPHE